MENSHTNPKLLHHFLWNLGGSKVRTDNLHHGTEGGRALRGRTQRGEQSQRE